MITTSGVSEENVKFESDRGKFNKIRETILKLESLSDEKLLGRLENLNTRERKVKLAILLYLAELEKRELYLSLGYSSLFDFCTTHLKYTRATAARRVRSARAVARYPEASEMLISGEINITILSKVYSILNRDNYLDVLSRIKNRSTREVEVLVSRHRPVRIIRDSVRPVCVMRPVESLQGVDDSGVSAGTDNNIEHVILEERLKISFSASPQFMEKYEKIKSLLSNKFPGGIGFELLFNQLMEEYLEKHDPERRIARRKNNVKNSGENTSLDDNTSKPGGGCSSKLESGKCIKNKINSKHNQAPENVNSSDQPEKSCPVESNNNPVEAPSDQLNSRYIPQAVRDQVYARDGGRCTFVGKNGKRCNCTWDLEFDHIVPFTRGGGNSPENLRLLCRNHNKLEAERVYGSEFMKRHHQQE